MANSITTDNPTLNRLVRYYDEFFDQSVDSRFLSEQDRDYYDGKQWTAEEIEILKKRKQPITTQNRIKPQVDFVTGIERQQRTDPKAFPRTPNHDQDAEAATDALRYVADNQDFDQKRSQVFEEVLVEGYAGMIVEAKPSSNEPEITLTELSWDRIYFDPHSRKKDFSDSKYFGIVIWMDEEDILQGFDVAAEDISASYSYQQEGDTFDDRPNDAWSDKERKRLKVCQIYWLEGGEWMWAIHTSGTFLIEPQPSPYLDENDQPECPIELMSVHINRENMRYGAVRQMIDMQDAINKRESKMLHQMNVRQVKTKRGAVKDIRIARRELAKPDGILEVEDMAAFEVLQTGDMAAGQFTLLQEAKDNIDIVGASSSVNSASSSSSGRALEIREQSNMAQVSPFFDGLKQWEKKVYRKVWNRVKQFWTGEKWVRVTDNEKNVRFVGLNRPVTLGEQMQQEGYPVDSSPIFNHVDHIENNVAEVDVDIIIEDSPDVVNIQAEQFELLVQLAQHSPEIDVLDVVSASSLRNKSEIIKRIEERRQSEIPPAQEVPPEIQQLQLADSQAEVEKKRAVAEKDYAQADKIKMEAALMPSKQFQ